MILLIIIIRKGELRAHTVIVFPGLRQFIDYEIIAPMFVKQYYLHPEYNWTQPDPEDDLALLQLDETINLYSKGAYTNMNSVCLPQSRVSYANGPQEFALISGWGLVSNESEYIPDNLQIGWALISSESTDKLIKVKYDQGISKPVICYVSRKMYILSLSFFLTIMVNL